MSLELFVDENNLWGSLPKAKKESKKNLKSIDLISILADTKEPTNLRSANNAPLTRISGSANNEGSKLYVFDAYQSNKVLGLTKQLEITSKKDSYKVHSKGFAFPQNFETFYGAIFPQTEQIPKIFTVSISGAPTVIEFTDKELKSYHKIKEIPPFVQHETIGAYTVLATLGASNATTPEEANQVQVFKSGSKTPIYKRKYASLARSIQDKLTATPGQYACQSYKDQSSTCSNALVQYSTNQTNRI
jgi:hypothetical protein